MVRAESGAPAETAALVEAPKRKVSLGLILAVVLALLWTTGLSLVVFHPTARIRATDLVDRALGRPVVLEPGEGEGPDAETPEMRLARIEADLAAEQLRLDGWQQALAARELAVAARETELAERELKLESAVADLLATGADLARLSRLCRQMKPRDAAVLLEGMANDQILLVLKGIADADAAKIIAAMTPARAAELMRLMAPEETARSTT